MPDPQRLVIVAPNWLGDAVMALPAVADLRRRFAGARLVVAARSSVAALFALVDGVDEVIGLPGRGGLTAVTGWRADVSALAVGRFDAAVLLPNSFLSAFTVSRARIAERWGFATDWRRSLLTRAVPKARGHLHQAAYYQALVAGLGIENGPRLARVIVSGAGNAEPSATPVGRARALLTASGVEGGAPFVVFAPGAAYGRAKQWLPERFAELATRIRQLHGRHVVLIGTTADGEVCAEIAKASGAAINGHDAGLVNLSGRTDLATLAGVLSLARAVVANDSGAMHLAGAVGAPVVAVFGATDETRTAPLTDRAESAAPVVLTHAVFCRPCMLRECPIDHRCMRGVAAQQVLDALRPYLS